MTITVRVLGTCETCGEEAYVSPDPKGTERLVCGKCLEHQGKVLASDICMLCGNFVQVGEDMVADESYVAHLACVVQIARAV